MDGIRNCHQSSNSVAINKMRWHIGIMSDTKRFLTAESFNFNVNVGSSTLKKRQMWEVIPDQYLESVFYLKSQLSRFLAADKDGNVTCDCEHFGKEDCQFSIVYCPHNSGRWALQNCRNSYYLGGSGDGIRCFSKDPVWWTPYFIAHPQVHLRHLVRQRYLRLSNTDDGSQLVADQILPWGSTSLITLHQQPEGDSIAIRACDGRYLGMDGSLYDTLKVPDCLYYIKIRSGSTPGLAFQSSNGTYLTLIGSAGQLKTKNSSIGKDEIFILEYSSPQVGIIAWNGKYASIKQGIDVYANQTEVSQMENFQLEFENDSKCRIRTFGEKLWTLSKSQTVQVTTNQNDGNTWFGLEYLPDNSVALQANNDMYVSVRKLGLIQAQSAVIGPEEKFVFVLTNRPFLVLRSDFGFVGIRNGRLDCAMINYDYFELSYDADGLYFIGNKDGLTWCVGDLGLLRLSSDSQGKEAGFAIQFLQHNKVSLRTKDGLFVRAYQNGTMKADSTDFSAPNIQWEV